MKAKTFIKCTMERSKTHQTLNLHSVKFVMLVFDILGMPDPSFSKAMPELLFHVDTSQLFYHLQSTVVSAL